MNSSATTSAVPALSLATSAQIPVQGPVVDPEERAVYAESDAEARWVLFSESVERDPQKPAAWRLSLLHLSETTRLRRISYAVFCLLNNKN
mgnify:CR=1 FL=1